MNYLKLIKIIACISLGGLLGGCATSGSVHRGAEAGFQWPLQRIKITSHFGKRKGEFHEGLDLKAPSGTPVYASQTGVVLYAGREIRGYGQLVVLRHSGKLATLYAHNSKILVRRGQVVKKGQKICISGASGHVTGPHLHFEIRKGLSPLNPISYLPRIESS